MSKKKEAINIEFGCQAISGTPASHVAIVGEGRRAYLWIGNGDSVSTIEGTATLRRLATEILKRLGDA